MNQKFKKTFAWNFKLIEEESNRAKPRRLVQGIAGKKCIVNPAYPPMKEREIDAVYGLPFTRLPHPRYRKNGTGNDQAGKSEESCHVFKATGLFPYIRFSSPGVSAITVHWVWTFKVKRWYLRGQRKNCECFVMRIYAA